MSAYSLPDDHDSMSPNTPLRCFRSAAREWPEDVCAEASVSNEKVVVAEAAWAGAPDVDAALDAVPADADEEDGSAGVAAKDCNGTSACCLMPFCTKLVKRRRLWPRFCTADNAHTRVSATNGKYSNAPPDENKTTNGRHRSVPSHIRSSPHRQ